MSDIVLTAQARKHYLNIMKMNKNEVISGITKLQDHPSRFQHFQTVIVDASTV